MKFKNNKMMNSKNFYSNRKSANKKAAGERGVVAIEFALLFVVFFTLFYGIVTYATIFLLKTSFHYAANEGARSAISIDRQSFANDSEYLTQGLTPKIRESVGAALQWLPNQAKNEVLGLNNDKIDISFSSNILTVRVFYPNYSANPLIPILSMPGIGLLYSDPSDLEGVATLNLS